MARYIPLSGVDRALGSALKRIFSGTEKLKDVCLVRRFTLDGRLVGDMGEYLAARYYEVKLFPKQTKGHDGVASGNRLVQIKVTFRDALAVRTAPDYLLGFTLGVDGSFVEVYNGPGEKIRDLCDPTGRVQRTLRVSELQQRNGNLPDRIPRRTHPLRILTPVNSLVATTIGTVSR